MATLQAPRCPSRQDWITGLLLIAAVLLAYYPAWHAGFIWDDDQYVTTNRLLTARDGLWRIWFSFDSPSQYFPLVYTVFRLEHALWGLAPSGYHWVNILLHCVNALLLWRLLARLEIPGAWLAAAIFALHPVQVESVAWVTELKNVLMGFFFLLSLLAWTAYTGGRTGRRLWFYALSLVLYALALFSKTTACTLPAALLLMACLRGERITARRLIEVVPFLVLGIGMGTLTVFWERYHQGTQGVLFALGLPARVLIASRAVWFYLGKLFWPAKLTFSYPRWTISPEDPAAYGWLFALCGLGWAALYARRYLGRGAWVAPAFYVATLGPVLGFFMLYTFRYSFVADHYQYLACIGPIALFSAGFDSLRLRYAATLPLAAPCLCAGLLGLLGLLTWRQSTDYRDSETLWRMTLARNPGSWLAHNNLGRALFARGRTDEAIAEFVAALRIDPDEKSYNNLGDALLKEGRTEEAVAQYRKALQVDPAGADAHYNLGIVALRQGRTEEARAEYSEALRINPALAEAWNNLGNILFQQGRVEEAIADDREALRINPDYADAHIDLANAWLQQGRLEEAVAEYRQALLLDPARADVHFDLGVVAGRQGFAQKAVDEYREALRIDPGLAEARNNLGLIFFQQGRTEDAIAEYREALRINPGYAGAHCNLATALDREGKDGEAIAHLERALELDRADPAIQNDLAWLLATAPQASIRDGARALELATAANQTTGGNNPTLLGTLAAAYAETGNFSNAAATARKALQLAGSDPAAADAFRREIKLYEAGRRFESGR
jgi:tetratricopeptide (TPR) repeat protein